MINKLIDSFKLLFEEQEEKIKNLQEENELLKSEHYKDEELSRLKKEIQDLNNEKKFVITNEEQKAMSRFLETHCCSNSPKIKSYRFDIIPGIGYNGYAICECGKEYCFYEE